MTDTTDPREGGSEYAELLQVLELQGGMMDNRAAVQAAAAIRALEAENRIAFESNANIRLARRQVSAEAKADAIRAWNDRP